MHPRRGERDGKGSRHLETEQAWDQAVCFQMGCAGLVLEAWHEGLHVTRLDQTPPATTTRSKSVGQSVETNQP